MTKNVQIESLFKELKTVDQNIEQEKNPQEIDKLRIYREELRANIEELSSKSEIDYELMGKTMLFRATANALMFKICKKDELIELIQELQDIGVPHEVLMADKEVLTRYLEQIEHPQPSKYERYHEFIRTVRCKSYRETPTKKQEFIKDFNWLMSEDSIGASIMDAFQIDDSVFKKILENKNEDFESLVERWHKLNCL